VGPPPGRDRTPQPVEVYLGDGTLVKITWKKANGTTAVREAVKELQAQERQGEVDVA
jgi:hypothetical protein